MSDMGRERGRRGLGGRGLSDMERERGRQTGIGGRGRREAPSRSRGARTDRDGRLILPETADDAETRNPQGTPDPAPQTQEQIDADRTARLAAIQRRGRGQTIIGAGRKLGEAVGPLIRRPTLG